MCLSHVCRRFFFSSHCAQNKITAITARIAIGLERSLVPLLQRHAGAKIKTTWIPSEGDAAAPEAAAAAPEVPNAAEDDEKASGEQAAAAAAAADVAPEDGAAEAADSKSSAGDVAGAAAAGEDDTAGGVVDGNKDTVDSAGLGLAAAGVEAPKGAGAVFSKDLGVLGKYRILVQAKRP